MSNSTETYDFITTLNGNVTSLTEQEIELLLEFRMSAAKEKEEIFNLIESEADESELSETN